MVRYEENFPLNSYRNIIHCNNLLQSGKTIKASLVVDCIALLNASQEHLNIASSDSGEPLAPGSIRTCHRALCVDSATMMVQDELPSHLSICDWQRAG